MKSKIQSSCFIVLILCLHSILNICTAQQTYIPHYTTKNGLPGNNCYYLLQDKQDFIWIGTDAGVSRFDGKVFENFSVDDGLADNQILRMMEDSRGRIWFLALNGKMSYFYKGKIYNSGNDKLLQALNFNASVISLLEDSKGRLWLGTNTNILGMWDGKKLSTYSSPDIKTPLINAFVHEDTSGEIRAYNAQAVQLFDGKAFKVEDNINLPLSYKTFNTFPDGKILFLRKDGLYQKRGAFTLIKQRIDENILSYDPGYFYSDEQDIWLSSTNGVYVIKPNSETTQYLQGIAINQVMKDRDGNFWFASSTGMYVLPVPEERLFYLTKEDGLVTNQVKSILKDKDNRFWLGMDNASISLFSAGWKRLNTIQLKDKAKYNKIKQLSFNSDSSAIYFASDYGLGRLENIYKTPTVSYLKEKNNSVFVIKSFSIDAKNNLAMALSSATVILPLEQEKFEFNASNYKENVNFFKARAYKVFFDRQQTLWFSNINGLSSFKDKKHIEYYQNNRLLDKRINDIYSIGNDELALATDGYGIILMKNGAVTRRITHKEGLSSNICYKICYNNGYLWVITNRGVNKITIKQKGLEIKTFDYASELLSSDINDIYVNDGFAYFATNNGLIFFANTNDSKSELAPKVHLTAVLADKKIVDLSDKNFILPSDYKTITFNYAGIDFKNRSVIFRYRLKKDGDWIETRNRRLEFSSLEPGKYTFEVAARSADGSWGKTSAFNFQLRRAFWQTIWFWLIVSLIAAFILYKITVTITRNQKNKEKAQLMMRNKILTLEQQALQAMMNPHFIFNVMNSIQHFINTQDKNAANKTLTGFARLIRKNLEICTKSFITIEEELEYLNLYLNLEKGRFGERFSYNIQIDPQIDREETLIPSMLLQPFVENAIWHGLMPKEENGKVEISLSLRENMMEIAIIDNGIGYENSINQKSEGHISKGMALTRERIRLINSIEQNSIQLTVQQLEIEGTLVRILIPLDNFNR